MMGRMLPIPPRPEENLLRVEVVVGGSWDEVDEEVVDVVEVEVRGLDAAVEAVVGMWVRDAVREVLLQEGMDGVR